MFSHLGSEFGNCCRMDLIIAFPSKYHSYQKPNPCLDLSVSVSPTTSYVVFVNSLDYIYIHRYKLSHWIFSKRFVRLKCSCESESTST